MTVFRTTIALTCASVTVLAGHAGRHAVGYPTSHGAGYAVGHGGGYAAGHGGGYYDDLGYGQGSLYGYGLGGMSYGLNYGRSQVNYDKAVIAKPSHVHESYGHGHGLGHGINQGIGHGVGLGYDATIGHGVGLGYGAGFDQRHLLGQQFSVGAYNRHVSFPTAGVRKAYAVGHELGHYGADISGSYGGGYGAGYALGYGKGLTRPVLAAPITVDKGYDSLLSQSGYGSLASPAGGYGASKAVIIPPPVKNYGGVGVGHSIGVNHRLVGYSKGLTSPLTFQKNLAAYEDQLAYGASYAEPLESHKEGFALSQGTPVYSGVVKAGVPVSLAHRK